MDRCISVLGTHPIVIVKPESLRLDALLDRHPSLLSENFADEFFADPKGYNRLMLSRGFYDRFAAYEYMLIHQLDAFVFSDQLMDWCSRGYDYIGAPWLPPGQVPGWFGQTLIAVRRKCHRFLNKKRRSKEPGTRPQFTYSAGNGGFSLRRVAAMRRVLAELDQRASL